MTLESTISLDGCEAAVIVKKNYMGEGISIESVATNPALFLDAVTVMFRRESGYDSDNQDWFWAKYRADGTLHANPRGRLLAERVAKNPEDGCIGCHEFAPGDDFVFLHDRFSPLVPVAVERPGWYALSLLYFEKRNTATPQLFWRRPGQGGG